MQKKKVNGLFLFILNSIKALTSKVIAIVKETEKNIIKRFVSATMLLVGGIFIGLAIVNLLYDYYSLNYGWGYLIVGLIAVLVSLLIKR